MMRKIFSLTSLRIDSLLFANRRIKSNFLWSTWGDLIECAITFINKLVVELAWLEDNSKRTIRNANFTDTGMGRIGAARKPFYCFSRLDIFFFFQPDIFNEVPESCTTLPPCVWETKRFPSLSKAIPQGWKLGGIVSDLYKVVTK